MCGRKVRAPVCPGHTALTYEKTHHPLCFEASQSTKKEKVDRAKSSPVGQRRGVRRCHLGTDSSSGYSQVNLTSNSSPLLTSSVASGILLYL